ncbi:hypothetical protein LOAG_01100 [Loa loa]|uniref:Uncharacterized protein n=1 Tax=Loa loa TaxID=7209 RepID=A0A1S0U9V8_LOALO|nr:hypothetical protein LOAG_01100 [Loa loa]EFO27389.1 hypothetical protein LOAG_01100 [Loa loa]
MYSMFIHHTTNITSTSHRTQPVNKTPISSQSPHNLTTPPLSDFLLHHGYENSHQTSTSGTSLPQNTVVRLFVPDRCTLRARQRLVPVAVWTTLHSISTNEVSAIRSSGNLTSQA